MKRRVKSIDLLRNEGAATLAKPSDETGASTRGNSRKCWVGIGTSLVLAVAGLALLTSCVVPPEGIPTVKGIEQDDIPVPPEFEFQNSQAPDYGAIAAGEFRSWKGTYYGGGDADELVPWYVREMPKFGWKFERLETFPNEKAIHFQKGGEYAVIRLSRRMTTSKGSYGNVLRAEVRPLGPENYTVDGNLQNIERQSARPASYSAPSQERGTDLLPQTPRTNHTPSARVDDNADLELRAHADREIHHLEQH